jgi:hypothetical protein
MTVADHEIARKVFEEVARAAGDGDAGKRLVR